MGDCADMFLETVLDYECLRSDYLDGRMTDEKAYDHGVIDERGYITTITRGKTCRCCGEGGLYWRQLDGRWRLFSHGGIHRCPVVPLQT